MNRQIILKLAACRSMALLTLVLCFCLVPMTAAAQQDARPRVVVLTDITNEPDDQESLVRFLVYSNEYQVDGLIATTSTWLRNRTSVANIRQCVSAYGKVRDNLARHADQFPTQAELDGVTYEGWPEFGMLGVGEDRDSDGSRHLIEVVDRDDPRPVWVTAWGGANCLAQALWRVRATRSPEEVARFVSKLRVYTISDQDDSGPWMRRQFPKLFYVVSPSGERGAEYYQATWTGISGDEYYVNGPGHAIDLVSNDWLSKNVRTGHGPLGEMYPKWEYIMEGDTPSFMNLINNGLASHTSPGFGGWGGRYAFKKTYADTGAYWQNSRDRVTLDNGRTYVSNTATIWRWRQAFQHDFAARMDWCVADSYEGANHNPVVLVEGDATKKAIHLDVEPGGNARISSAGTKDPDGDELTFHWFHYPEAGRDLTNERDEWSVELSGEDSQRVTVMIPKEPPRGVRDIHLILDVEDNGQPSLHAYRRVILHLKE